MKSKSTLKRLTCVLPGLTIPLAQRTEELPAGTKLLGRARQEQKKSLDFLPLLFSLFNLEPSSPLPCAPLTALACGLPVGQQYWLRADPIHCLLDRAAVFIKGQAGLDLTVAEEEILLSEINAYLQDENLQLSKGAALQWFLSLPVVAGMHSEDLINIVGKNWAEVLPLGPNKQRWQRLLIELQILLQRSTVNIARRARGANTVDALWFWGGGVLPLSLNSRWQQVWSTETLALGLAKNAHIQAEVAPDAAQICLDSIQAGDYLVVRDELYLAKLYGEQEKQQQILQTWETTWFAPLLSALKNKELDELTIYTDKGSCYQLTPATLQPWWQRLWK